MAEDREHWRSNREYDMERELREKTKLLEEWVAEPRALRAIAKDCTEGIGSKPCQCLFCRSISVL